CACAVGAIARVLRVVWSYAVRVGGRPSSVSQTRVGGDFVRLVEFVVAVHLHTRRDERGVVTLGVGTRSGGVCCVLD
ncbi:hypothetical protein F5148DRAFT_1209850, partial [Russula earlei]